MTSGKRYVLDISNSSYGVSAHRFVRVSTSRFLFSDCLINRFCVQCGKPQLRPQDMLTEGADRVLFVQMVYPSGPFSAVSCSGCKSVLNTKRPLGILPMTAIHLILSVSTAEFVVKRKGIDIAGGFRQNKLTTLEWTKVKEVKVEVSGLQKLVGR